MPSKVSLWTGRYNTDGDEEPYAHTSDSQSLSHPINNEPTRAPAAVVSFAPSGYPVGHSNGLAYPTYSVQSCVDPHHLPYSDIHSSIAHHPSYGYPQPGIPPPMSAHPPPLSSYPVDNNYDSSAHYLADAERTGSSDNSFAHGHEAPVPRGKPEAMAAALAAARIQAQKQELEAEKEEAEAVGEPVVDDSFEEAVVEAEPPKPKKKKPSAPKKKAVNKKPPPNSVEKEDYEDILSRPAEPITDVEYENLEALMVHFCRVPLLAEFSRPVALLHPELMNNYSKIVTHPVDLGHVCRGIRRRQYKYKRDIRLDMWRVFANCVKFHSHPNNKEAVPSFVSIALHLRDYFNSLWQEYMMPSELPEKAPESVAQAFRQRSMDRKLRIENSGILVLSNRFASKTAVLLGEFLGSGGCVDKLDTKQIFGPGVRQQDRAIIHVTDNILTMKHKLEKLSKSTEEYTLEQFYSDLKALYSIDAREENILLQSSIANRLDRFFWKLVTPLHEANSRGVTQSSVWGNVCATVWARESSKKPFWPALVLGILAPSSHYEGWHQTITDRNESRLPEKLRVQLMGAKKKCEQAQKRQALSYFLVEFLGTHEFVWVRETDVIEGFDPEDDPNKKVQPNSKKKRSSRSGVANVINSKTYQNAIEECVWTNEESSNVIQDAMDYTSEEEETTEGEDMNYSYTLLAQSDDEADEEDDHGYEYNESKMSLSDVEEANRLLSHDGKIDASAAGRKIAKKRTQAMKKQASGKDKKEPSESAKKSKSDAAKKKKEKAKKDVRVKEREDKKELRELEKRRRKRSRDREKALRSEAKKQNKRRRTFSCDSEEDDRGLGLDKRARATAIVKAYLTRMAKESDYSTCLGQNGVMTMPASLVDSTGLLGMALAFRAASGELYMPDDIEEQMARREPWKAIDVDQPKKSNERIALLKRKIELIKTEMDRLKENTAKRKKLTEEAVAERIAQEKEVESDELAARQNHFRKKKKSISKPGPTVENVSGSVEDDTPPDDTKSDAGVDSTNKDDQSVDGEEQVGNEDDAPMEAESVDSRADVASNQDSDE